MKRIELLIRVLLLPLDYFVVFFSFLFAYQFRGYVDEIFLLPIGEFLPLISVLSIIWIISFWALGVYRLDTQRSLWEEVFAVVLGSIASITVSGAVVFFIKEIDFSRIVLLITTIIAITFLLVLRLVRLIVMRYLYRRGIAIKKTLIIGNGDTTDLVLSGIKAAKDPSIKVVGVVSIQDFEKQFKATKPDVVIQSNPYLTTEQTANVISLCEENNSKFSFIHNVFDLQSAKIMSEDLAGVPIVTVSLTAVDGWYAVVKRLLDIIGSLFGLVVLAPLFIVTAIAIRLDSRGTVLYRHKRVGRGGHEFELLKFRSMQMLEVNGMLMHSDANTEVEKIKDAQKNYKLVNDPRITKVGSFIRKTSIDELPQLINVLKGDLSLVGPRAYLKKELVSQLERYPEAGGMVRRLVTVRPGITGVWQVSGRSNVDFSERVAMDAYYATRANLFLDIKILVDTIPVVIKGTGAM